MSLPPYLRELFLKGSTLGVVVVLASCSEDPTRVQEPVPSEVELSTTLIDFASLDDTLRIAATVLDQNGAPMPDVPVSWRSSRSSVATVSPEGLVTAMAEGDAVITASASAAAGGASATRAEREAMIRVRQMPDHVRFDPDVIALENPGDTVSVRATVVDANLNEVPVGPLSWSSTDPSVVEITPEGSVSAVGDGRTSIVATSDAVTGELSAFVGGQNVVVASVSPAVLVEDSTATIRGLGFSQELDGNTVTLDGAEAEIIFATSTELRFTVPDADCRPARTGTIGVAAFELSDSAPAEVRPAVTHELEVGEGVYAGEGCLHLAGGSTTGERYLVGILSSSEVASSLTPARLMARTGSEPILAGPIATAGAAVGSGEPGGATWGRLAGGGGWFRAPEGAVGAPLAAQGGPPRATPTAVSEALDPGRLNARLDRNRAESRIRAEDRRLMEAFGPPRSDGARALGAPGRAPLAVVPSRGDTLDFNVPGFQEASSPCTDATQIRGVVRHVGAAAVFVDDVENPTDGFTTSDYQGLDELLLETTLPTITEYFGSLTDIDDNDGKIVVLITKEVNERENLRGFVFSGDLVSPQQCTDSNQAEIFYGLAPDPGGAHGTPQTAADVLSSYPTLIAHEVTHIAQFVNGGGIKTRWELEGGATLAEQLVGHEVLGHGPRQNLGADALAADMEGWYIDWVVDMALYFGFLGQGERADGAPEECSWIGTEEQEGNVGPCENVRAVYGVPATLLRFVLDDYGRTFEGGDAGLMQRLTSSSRRGLETLEDATGEDAVSLLVRFGVTLWADDRVGDWLQSWNIYDIFQDLNENARLQPYGSTAAEPSLEVQVRAASNAYLEWRPPPGHDPTSLRIRTPGGDMLPEHMVLWVLRAR